MESTTYANPAVLEFYKTLPFNYRESVQESVKAIRERDLLGPYPVLAPLLKPGVSVLEVGCGTGWMSNSISARYGAAVEGIDFNPVAVERAREVAAAAGLSTRFNVADLFLFEPEKPCDVVISIGVLHHTDNCLAAVRRVCDRFVAPGGHVFIGLYHTFGRKPFLDHFRQMRQRGASEEQMFARYRELHSQLKDETLLMSWFRDQVLHPHETQHTLAEMLPILQETGMELVSTSINEFQPIDSLESLIAQEARYEKIGQERLRENKYFTGFFVFLARKRVAGEAASSTGAAIDSKPYVRYHPVVGYEYIPGTCMTLPRPGGGDYTIRVNSAGIRSDREYAKRKPAGVYRILVCGDSMSAGQYVSNDQRFSELLERRIPGLEVVNFALEGSGTDQELLIFEREAREYEFDLVILLPFLQNIRRNMADRRIAIDPQTHRPIYRAKPRFDLVEGKLVLRNVPVSAVPIPVDQADEETLNTTDDNRSFTAAIKSRTEHFKSTRLLKRVLKRFVAWEPFPEYKDPDNPAWKVMEAIVRRFKEVAGEKPLVVVPLFYSSYVEFHPAMNYLKRFQSIREPGLITLDVLPYFRALGRDALRCFQEPHDCHFSVQGQLVLADALQRELTRLNLLPRAT